MLTKLYHFEFPAGLGVHWAGQKSSAATVLLVKWGKFVFFTFFNDTILFRMVTLFVEIITRFAKFASVHYVRSL